MGSELAKACEEGNPEKVKDLLGKGADPNEVKDGHIALLKATRKGKPGIVKMLLDAGADPNLTAAAHWYENKTALCWCAREGRLPIAKLLVAAGAKGTRKEKTGNKTALQWAQQKKNKAMIEIMQSINPPGHWDVMISYTQTDAEAKLLAAEVYSALRERGKTAWMDIKMNQLNEAAMREAAENSGCIIAVVTGADGGKNSYFKREYCMKELRWARAKKIPIQPIIRREDKAHVGKFVAQAPKDLKYLGGVDFKCLDRVSPSIWNACIKDMLDGIKRLKK